MMVVSDKDQRIEIQNTMLSLLTELHKITLFLSIVHKRI